MADDEFVIGYWDSEWTGIAPVLEEDVAFASLAQDEIGHAQALYQLLADLEGGDPDELAYGRAPEGYRHARLLDHPRTDWAFSVARRFLYDTADAARLDALAASAYQPLAGVVAKMRREEAYHLLHMHAWVERLATGGQEPRARLVAAMERLWPDALCVLDGIEGDELLAQAGVLAEPMAAIRTRWLAGLAPELARLGLPGPPAARAGACRGPVRSDDFRWLWEQFTMAEVPDPEIPVVSVVDLGLVHTVELDGERLRVELLPTFVGCPALELIRGSVAERLAGMAPVVEVEMTFAVPWTSDRITGEGRRKLRESGFAPPGPAAGGAARPLFATIAMRPTASCPWCGSADTTLENLFGPTLCRTVFWCNRCRQPFEQFKAI